MIDRISFLLLFATASGLLASVLWSAFENGSKRMSPVTLASTEIRQYWVPMLVMTLTAPLMHRYGMIADGHTYAKWAYLAGVGIATSVYGSTFMRAGSIFNEKRPDDINAQIAAGLMFGLIAVPVAWLWRVAVNMVLNLGAAQGDHKDRRRGADSNEPAETELPDREDEVHDTAASLQSTLAEIRRRNGAAQQQRGKGGGR